MFAFRLPIVYLLFSKSKVSFILSLDVTLRHFKAQSKAAYNVLIVTVRNVYTILTTIPLALSQYQARSPHNNTIPTIHCSSCPQT